jgi:hypothetical protein
MLRKPKSVGKTRRAATGAKPKALKTQPASAPVRIDSGPQRPGSRKMSNNARPQSGMKASSYKRTSLGAKQSAEGQRAAEEIVGHREHIRELFREGTYAEYDAFQVVVLLGRMLVAQIYRSHGVVALQEGSSVRDRSTQCRAVCNPALQGAGRCGF